MKVRSVLKKRTNIFLGSCMLVILAVIITFIAITKSGAVNNKVLVDNKNLQVIYKNDNENVDKSLEVMTFQQGIEEIKAELIEIVNKKDFSTSFSLCVQQIDTSSDELSLDKVYYKVNDSSGIVGSKENNCILSGDIAPNGRVLLNVKIWIGEELITNTDQGKELSYKYYIK